jgi:ubiquinone biosynthesis protein COQ9
MDRRAGARYMSDMITTPDLQADPSVRLRDRLLDAMLDEAVFGGWTRSSVQRAAAASGLSEGEALLAAPAGAIDLIDAWAARADAAVVRALADAEGLKIRQKATLAVRTRIDVYRSNSEAMRRALVSLALPGHAGRGAAMAWRAADSAWAAMGDASTDFNWYTKRAILMGVTASTIAYWMQDSSPDLAPTWAFLDRRIENIMQFETVKAGVARMTAGLPDPVALLTRLRYGPQPRP